LRRRLSGAAAAARPQAAAALAVRRAAGALTRQGAVTRHCPPCWAAA
jgi:hypothetical protein